MKKALLAVALAAVVASGCVATIGVRQVGFMVRWINLTVVHECSNRASIHQGQTKVMDLVGATPGEVGLYPANSFDDEILVIAQSLDSGGGVVGTNTYSFRLYNQTSSWTWVISDESWGIGRNIVRSPCPRR